MGINGAYTVLGEGASMQIQTRGGLPAFNLGPTPLQGIPSVGDTVPRGLRISPFLPAAGAAEGASLAIGGALRGLAGKPVPLPIAAGTILGAAILGYVIGSLIGTQNGTQATIPGGIPIPTQNGVYGNGGNIYDVTTQINSENGTSFQNARSGFGPFKLTDFGFTPGPLDSRNYSWFEQFGEGSISNQIQSVAVGGSVAVRVIQRNTGQVVPNPNNNATIVNVPETRSPAQTAASPIVDNLPGFPRPASTTAIVPTKAASIVPVVGRPPLNAPKVQIVDVKTGKSLTTKKGTGVVEIHDPRTGETAITPAPKTPAEAKKAADQKKGIGAIPVSCPDPCPEVDLAEVLAKIAEVKSDVSDLQDTVGFTSASVATYCGTTKTLESVQSFLEIVDNKLGFDEPLTVPEGTNGGSDVCDAGTALEALLTIVPTQVVFQGFEVRALRFAQLVVYFNTDIRVIKTRFQMSCPNPVANLSKAVIKAAYQPRIPGEWFVSLKTIEGTEITGWFASEAAGIAYLTQVATLTTNSFNPVTAFTATHRPGKGPDLTAGTIIYPVVAFLYEGPGQSAFSERIVLRD